MRLQVLIFTALLAAPTLAEEIDEGGILNPDEMSLSRSVRRALEGDVDMVLCSQGYLMTKSGSHAEARAIFEECARQGWTGSMTWMSYMEDNGFGGDYNPDAAADWDLRAAEAGDPIGSFNHGLDLLRGHGVTQDLAKGKRLIDHAASNGVKVAQELQSADYDPSAVTPDADEWKYQPNY